MGGRGEGGEGGKEIIYQKAGKSTEERHYTKVLFGISPDGLTTSAPPLKASSVRCSEPRDTLYITNEKQNN